MLVVMASYPLAHVEKYCTYVVLAILTNLVETLVHSCKHGRPVTVFVSMKHIQEIPVHTILSKTSFTCLK